METAYATGAASLVCFADGSTSLYFSTGGGIIGAGEHETVRIAARRFLSVANDSVALLKIPTDHPLPELGRVRFYARTRAGLRGAEVAEDILGDGAHPLSRLFAAGHFVISAIRETGRVGID
jgi:hypothetical protein